ncbi:amidohydrolase family protein [Xanthomonas bundabergensis]|uniref:amidohydrolase family protein n=1 Tax=Xanthomonas bundabergensis TaxID=3160842 RepID=UPI003515F6C8
MKAIFGLCVAACAAWAAPAWSAQTLRYVVLVDGGKQAGQQSVSVGDDGVTRVDYVFKDNGRGPELKEQYTLAADGTFKTYQVQGSSTFGAPVDERFSRDGDRVRWKSTSDQGERRVPGGAQYWPLGGTPAAASAAVTALSRRADGKLPLIPSGTLTLRKLQQAQVGQGNSAREVQLVALTGVGFTPTFAWLTTGAAPRLFAFIAPGWMQLIETGYEKDAAALEAAQKQAEVTALVELQQRLAHPLPGTTLIRNARVFDSEHATLGAASDVLLRDGKIVSVNATGGAPAPAQQVVDAQGRVLLPGLFDMHGHVGRWDGGLHLAAGVTTVRDMGNDNATLQQVMQEERDGQLLMPSLVACGFLEGESPMSARNGFVVSTQAQANEAVDWYAAHGYVGIKIYNSFPQALVRDTAAYAHAKGLRVSGHIPVHMLAHEAVEQGYDEIQHINQVLLNFYATHDTDTRTLERFYLPAKRTADLDFDSAPVQAFVQDLARRQIAIDSTVATFDFIRQRPGELSQAYAAVAEHLPPDVQRGLRSAEFDIPDDATAALYERSYEKMVAFVGRLYQAGVPLVAGTDATPGFTLQREIELYVQAGLTPAQALQVATWNGAKYSRTLDSRGSITPGKRADLILVDGDPTRDIADLRKVALVVKQGTAYYPSEVYTALGIAPFAAPARIATMED